MRRVRTAGAATILGQHGPALRRWAIAALVLLAVELAMGLVIGAAGLPAEDRYAGAGLVLAALYAVAAVALLRSVLEIALRGSAVGSRRHLERVS